MASITRVRTKLEKDYYKMRLVSIGVNYCFLLSLSSMILSFSFMLIPVFAIVYVIYALFASIILIIGTLFLILINTSDPENPLHVIWSRLDKLEEVLNPIVQFAQIAVPIIGGSTIALSIVLIVLVSKNLGRSHKAKDIAFLVIAIIFSILAIFISQAVALSSK